MSLVRRGLIAVSVSTAVAVSACSASRSEPNVHVGTALAASGFATTGFFAFAHANVGETYLFALPFLTNTSTAPVTITGYRIASVTGAATAEGFLAYSTHDTPHGDIYYTAVAGQPDAGIDVSTLPDHIAARRVLQPGKHDDLIVMAKVRLRQRSPSTLHGCIVRYRTRGDQFDQRFHCDFSLDHDGP